MTDKEFLTSIYARLHWVNQTDVPFRHEDSRRLKAIIERTPDDQYSVFNGMEPTIEDRIGAFKAKYPASAKDLVDILYAINNRMDANGLFKVVTSTEREAARQRGMSNSL